MTHFRISSKAWILLRTILLGLLAPLSVFAAQVFTVDPTRSSLTLSGNVVGGDLVAQGPGSLTTSLGGVVQVLLSPGNIQFVAGSRLSAAPSGDWQPLSDGSPGRAPASFGGQVNLGILSATAALRDIQLELSSGSLPMDDSGRFDGSSLAFLFPADATGSLAYDTSGFGHGKVPLAGAATNKVGASATLARSGSPQVLTIPIDTTFRLKLLSPDDTVLTLKGQLVAVADIPVQPLPPIGAFSVNPGTVPILTSNPWHFHATYAAQAPDLQLRVQSTQTPGDAGSWVDLPGNPVMTRTDSEWDLDSTEVPEGNRYFRVSASAPGHDAVTSASVGPYVVIAVPRQSQTFDASTDFSTGANPNGAWSYGYATRLGGGLTLYSDHSGNAVPLGFWRNDIALGAPIDYVNLTDAAVANGSQQIGPRLACFHPGPNGEYSVYRFNAPAAGEYRLKASFEGVDTAGTTTDVHVLVNDAPIFSGAVNGFGVGSRVGFSTNLVLRTGDRVDFAVGNGGNGFYFDGTGIEARLGFTPQSKVHVEVPGSANPWLAGAPSGTPGLGGDVAPAQSPVLVPGLARVIGITFRASGSAGYQPGSESGPEGFVGARSYTINHAAENGVGAILNAPVSALIGVFLGDGSPGALPTPTALDFGADAARDYARLAPALAQPFYIGLGAVPGGPARTVVPPAGATRLFLGTMDGSGWYNNVGRFQVDLDLTVTADPLPLPVLGSFSVNAGLLPIRTSNPWRFHVTYPAEVPDLRLRVQSTRTPSDEGSWTDLPGDPYMTRLDSDWDLGPVHVPEGNRYFRAVATAPGYIDRTSTINGPTLVLPAATLPALGSFSVSPGASPIRTSNPWHFHATYPAVISDLRLRIQSTLTPADEGSWTDLSGNPFMTRVDSEWDLRTTQVPDGNRYFRVIASAPGYVDRVSGVGEPFLVLPGLAPFRGFTYATVLPYQSGVGWSFAIVQSATVPGLRLRLQSSGRPEDPGSWSDLPGGGGMNRRADGYTWVHYTTAVPVGDVSFRVIASAPDHADLLSEPSEIFHVVPKVGIQTAKVTQGGKYSLQSLPGWLTGIGNFVVNAVGAVVHLIVHEDVTTQAAVTLAASPGSSNVLTVDKGQVLTAAGVNVGPNSSVIISGTIGGSLIANPLISQDGGSLSGAGGGSLVARDGVTAEAIVTASLLQRTDSPVISNDGASVISNDGNSVISNDSAGLISQDGGSWDVRVFPLASPARRASVASGSPGTGLSAEAGSAPVDLALDGPATLAGLQPAFTGPMRVTGDYTQGPGAALVIGIAGIRSLPDGPQQYDQLVVDGEANFLGGRIVFGFFNPEDPAAATGRFEPAVGSAFDVVVARSIRVTGLTVRGPVWGDGRFFRWGVVTRADGRQALRLVVVRVPPVLGLRPVATGLELAYATNYVGYRLESSVLSTPGRWSILSTNPGPTVVKPSEGAAFYRLLKVP